MNRLLIFHYSTALCFLLSTQAAVASDNSPLGSRSWGMGNASVSLSDVWSTQNNQAGLGFLKRTEIGTYYQNQFYTKELGTSAFSFATPTKHGTFGVCLSNFGFLLFNQTKIGFAFGKSFGEKIAAGIMLDYLETSIAEYGKRSSLVAEAGIQTKPTKDLTIGIHLFNISRTKQANYNNERMATILRLGTDYKFSKKVLLEKDVEKKAISKIGLEYQPINNFFLRLGVSSNPALSNFGIGFKLKQIQLDLSSSYHSTLGISSQIGLKYEFNNAKP